MGDKSEMEATKKDAEAIEHITNAALAAAETAAHERGAPGRLRVVVIVELSHSSTRLSQLRCNVDEDENAIVRLLWNAIRERIDHMTRWLG